MLEFTSYITNNTISIQNTILKLVLQLVSVGF
jgi:hypothetical protein